MYANLFGAFTFAYQNFFRVNIGFRGRWLTRVNSRFSFMIVVQNLLIIASDEFAKIE